VAPVAANHPPPPDPWTVAIHLSPTDTAARGTGFVIDTTRVLTAAHVVAQGGAWRSGLWVSFPKADGVPYAFRLAVARCLPTQRAPGLDLAVLELEEPVPAAVTPARLRCPYAHHLYESRWWAFGFPQPAGADARGRVGAKLAYGMIKLNADDSGVAQGFSGSALWSPDYDAVVGIVIAAGEDKHEGDGHALTLARVDAELPDLKLGLLATWNAEAAGEAAHAAWWWSLRTDPEHGRHWSPRARGVAADSERGYRFRGRRAALTRITRWLDRAVPVPRVLVVTGSPGVGKSAVLGRVVTTADREIRALLPAGDDGVRATVGSVACAVHAKGKTAMDVATEIARAASVGLPERPEDLVPQLRERLRGRVRGRPDRFNLVVDALDETAGPEHARVIIETIVVPLARTCADVGAAVVVGTRRGDDAGDLLDAFGDVADVLDLDDERYHAEDDLFTYALSTLQLYGAERAGNPYHDEAIAVPVARRIAAMAGRNFLVAGLTARAHGMYDDHAVDPATMVFTRTVDDALEAYVAGLPPADSAPARLALTVLAYAEAPGLPVELWAAGIAALGGQSTVDGLRTFAHTSAANFLVESGTDPAASSYRLFHQALNEALLRARARVEPAASDEGRLFDAWRRIGRTGGWASAPEYLLRWLPAHATRTRRVDVLLVDDGYLLNADLRRLLAAADGASTRTGRARARLLRLTPQAMGAPPAQRAAMFSVTEVLDHLDCPLAVSQPAPYVGFWANTPPRPELTVLEGHTDAVLDVCAVPVGARTLVASAGEDSTVRLWDPVTGQPELVLQGHTDRVRALCTVPVGPSTLLASGGDDGRIAVWDPRHPQPLRQWPGHTDWVRAVCSVVIDGETIVASAGDDRTVRLWEPLTGQPVRVLDGHVGWATALCSVTLDDRTLLVSGGYEGTIVVWDARTGAGLRQIRGHTERVTALAPVTVAGRVLLASASYDGTVRLWDLDAGTGARCEGFPEVPVTDLCVVEVEGRELLAGVSHDGKLHLHDPTGARPHQTRTGHDGRATGVCALSLGGRALMASGGEDAAVRLWDATTGKASRVLDGGRVGPVAGLCSLTIGGRETVATTTDGGAVRLWDAATGAPGPSLTGHRREVLDVCAVTLDGRTCLASAGQDGRVLVRDAVTGDERFTLAGHADRAVAVCLVPTRDMDLLASVGDDQTVRLWDLATGGIERELFGHTGWVHAVCAIPGPSGTRVVSASHDGTARAWDVATGTCDRVLGGHQGAVNAVCRVPVDGTDRLATAGADGLIRLWNLGTDQAPSTLDGHPAEVTSLCVARSDGRQVLVSASMDRTVRLWDPASGALLLTIPVHHRALCCRYASGTLYVGLERGLVAIALR
jgi:WD40 repeat protein